LLEQAQQVVSQVVRSVPCRTLLVVPRDGGEAGIVADISLHRSEASGPPIGDAVVLEATGGGREWLPENVERLALADLPVCLWWVGDLPDFDRLFDRLSQSVDVIVVNSGEMDLRDLQKLSEIAARSQDRFALTDLTWFRLRPLQELIARFFDDEAGLSRLTSVKRLRIVYAPRENEADVASTQAGLLLGWMANALSLKVSGAQWRRGEGWGEATFGDVVVRFEQGRRADVPSGTILHVALEADAARFEVMRQEDPHILCWSREVPGAPMPPQTVRSVIPDEAKLLVRCLERPKRDPLLEASLHSGSLAVRQVAPRLSRAPVPY
jgi:hypothetical protein